MIDLLREILVIPVAHADITQLGAGGAGVSDMWGDIQNIFPHTNAGAQGIPGILIFAMDFVLKTIAAAAVPVIIYAGIKMITGGEEGLGEGKKIITYAVAGLVCALLGDVVVGWVCEIVLVQIGGGGGTCPSLI